MMLRPQIFQNSSALLPLYEQNYMLFRLVLPELPPLHQWFVLEAQERSPLYGYRLSTSPYTSEWLLGHFFPQRKRQFAPDFRIRVYHDARLVEAMPPEQKPVGEVRMYKLALNRALGEWLDYCHRYRYRLNQAAEVGHLLLPEGIK